MHISQPLVIDEGAMSGIQPIQKLEFYDYL